MNVMSAAGEWFDAHLPEAIDAPDEAFDRIWMLKPNDWSSLRELFGTRPQRWREAFAYVVAEGPPEEGLLVLRLALEDPSDDVAIQAALSAIDLGERDRNPSRLTADDLHKIEVARARAVGVAKRSAAEIGAFLDRRAKAET